MSLIEIMEIMLSITVDNQFKEIRQNQNEYCTFFDYMYIYTILHIHTYVYICVCVYFNIERIEIVS